MVTLHANISEHLPWLSTQLVQTSSCMQLGMSDVAANLLNFWLAMKKALRCPRAHNRVTFQPWHIYSSSMAKRVSFTGINVLKASTKAILYFFTKAMTCSKAVTWCNRIRNPGQNWVSECGAWRPALASSPSFQGHISEEVREVPLPLVPSSPRGVHTGLLNPWKRKPYSRPHPSTSVFTPCVMSELAMLGTCFFFTRSQRLLIWP